jgi:glycosyltransferase involved in cell wall biosynthesis
MTTPPLVSVVAIFLDAERFLEEAVQSVIGQTYPHWELLLVDDGSSDGSTAAARRLAEQHPDQVRYLEHPGHCNLGMSASRNLGLQHARGEYLALLDADDVWLPEKLERQVAILEAHPEVGLLFGAPLYWFGWTGKPEDRDRDYVIDLHLEVERVYAAPDLLLPFLRRTVPTPCPSDVLVRRARAVEVGGFEAHFTGVTMVYEDQAFFSKLVLHAPTFASGQTWDRYRQHPDSCYAVSKATGRREIARRYFLKWFQRYLRAQGRASGPVWETVRAELRRSSILVEAKEALPPPDAACRASLVDRRARPGAERKARDTARPLRDAAPRHAREPAVWMGPRRPARRSLLHRALPRAPRRGYHRPRARGPG